MPQHPKHRHAAVLVRVQLPGTSEAEHVSSLRELDRLCDTLGLKVIRHVSQQRPALVASTIVGSGKLAEIAILIDTHRGEFDSFTVVFDNELSPSQMKNLEETLGTHIMDRRGVIIEIFSRNARSREAKIEVEIARLTYQLPKLRLKHTGGDRQRGGSGGGIKARGPGVTPFEAEKKATQNRLNELRRQLDQIAKVRKVQSHSRRDAQRVAIVGYTNAGKSSLMRALTGREVLVEDKLFATLGTTVRTLHAASETPILLSDTVGFIKDLPHDLMASFRSTLDEAATARFCMHVVDASDPAFQEQLRVTKEVLAEIGVDTGQSLLVFNKIDAVDEDTRLAIENDYPEALLISAHKKGDVERLKTQIQQRIW